MSAISIQSLEGIWLVVGGCDDISHPEFWHGGERYFILGLLGKILGYLV